jgi:multidrug transporter EmrE-like cation transporter
MNLFYGVLYGIIAQIITFLQLQGNIKYGWFHKYPLIVLASAVPISYLFIKSVEHLVKEYNGELWPSRLIGFGIGAIVFTVLSWLLFKEPFTLKTGICMLLASAILIIQIIWK